MQHQIVLIVLLGSILLAVAAPLVLIVVRVSLHQRGVIQQQIVLTVLLVSQCRRMLMVLASVNHVK